VRGIIIQIYIKSIKARDFTKVLLKVVQEMGLTQPRKMWIICKDMFCRSQKLNLSHELYICDKCKMLFNIAEFHCRYPK